MKVVLQRVQRASVTIAQKRIAQIKNGALLLVGFGQNDDEQTVDYLARKISKSRIFSDQNGKINLAINDVQGQILSVSQFTLYADTAKGNRPSFVDALNPQQAEKLYDLFNEKLRASGCDVQTGVFGADMQVELVNDGPLTIIYER
ncbi:D-tyrosyl-tRNA(Tyr) deacylase [Lactobacillus sp. W8089]|nr:D-tyrosyl-tRNA(Tyr) deacylase [Lactobacillus sp. W8086]MBI0109249.1 D-tyrosyl-tRNA(Tyr) deacylase [Lactobacillus sp. W8085]MBI0112366.1 D-tyrosyl-tRNA(Tyr) deacylase [Lactobacillus sp. W8088]MBI0116181.1 D-tyrosyl-tRNA(Tyr) deacylase [Lactobacillus sp. W8087]MBI0119807.1 D-tyrosyl-tRNA(Tyr) deacylase [Lactobacillus sp. W8089]MBI0131772.1 D-tyrosyl-tRNA(Tyr) deacylase [Lactobacillus sp. W8090]